MSAQLRDLGEKAFIAQLLAGLRPADNFVNGFGHDASIIDLGLADTLLVMKIDRAAQPIASIRGWTDFRLWGRLAVTANCSDILAIGGEPKALMLSVCLPGDWEAAAAEDVVLGCQEECERHGVAFVGGDTKEATQPQVVASAIGLIPRGRVVRRHAANIGDVILYAGQLGGYLGAYFQLAAGHVLPDEDCARLIEYVARPTARWRESALVYATGMPSAATDCSDGLMDVLSSLLPVGLGIELDIDAIPLHPFACDAAAALGLPAFNLAFGVGDWGIGFAVPPACADAVMASVAAACDGIAISRIGRVTAEPGIFATESRTGRRFAVTGVVNEHFRARMEDQGNFMRAVSTLVALTPT